MFNKFALDIQGRHFEGEHVFAFGVVTILAALALTKRYFAGGRCHVERNLEGKLAVITGGNTGIGKETARKMAKLGCTVIIGARDTRKNEETVNQIRKQFPHASISSERLDLGDKKSIVRFAEFVKAEAKKVGDGNHLDYLVNNAGVMAVLERRLTADGMEMQIGINHFGHFYLTYQLWDLVKNSPAPRITNVSSLAHQQQGKTYGIDFNNIFYQNGGYNPGKAYTSSKIANILFTKELQKRMDERKINGISMALHPGVVRTELVRNITQSFAWKALWIAIQPLAYIFFKSPEEGAQTTLHTLLEDEDKLTKGGYYSDCREKALGCDQAKDPEAACKLWKMSEEVYNIKFDL